jgi:hypothetical protein
MSEWRYIAQRVLTGEFLHQDLPIDRGPIGWDLSGPGSFSGTIAPDLGSMRADDGRLLLEEWGTYIYAEADGEIKWGGIVVSSKFEDHKWTVEAAGFTTYPHGLPYTSTYRGVRQDPAAIVRHLWEHLQSKPDGNLGVVVTGSTTLRLGTSSDETLATATSFSKQKKADYDAAARALKDARASLAAARASLAAARRELARIRKIKGKPGEAAAIADVNEWVSTEKTRIATVDSRKSANDAAKRAYDSAEKARKEAAAQAKKDGGAYKLMWWDAPDCGTEIDRLATLAPFDYVEKHSWDGDAIRHEVAIVYPRAGRRRDDLAFAQGVNITSVVSPIIDGDEFANEIVGLGAGEGAGSIRRATALRDGRLRRTHVFTAKTIGSNGTMDALIRGELLRRQTELDITEIRVRDHENAPIGSWALGDHILVQATIPWLGDVDLWCRILGWELIDEGTARLTLNRSDASIYGG